MMAAPRRSSQQSAQREEYNAQFAASQLGRLMDPRISLPVAPVAVGRAAEIVAILSRQLDFVHRPVTVDASTSPLDQVARAIAGSQIRTRRITLAGGWWERNVPPMVVQIDGGLAVIMPGHMYRPMLHMVGADPIPVTAIEAERIADSAIEVIRPLPGRSVGVGELLRLGLAGPKRDLAITLVTSILVGFIGLSIPLATAVIFNEIVPNGDVLRLIMFTVILVALSLSAALFKYTSVYHFIRLGDSIEMTTGGAVFDRILRLPVSALRQWSSAALASRILMASALQNALGDAIMMGLLSLVLTVLNGVLLVVLIPSLGLVALFFGVILVLLMLLMIRKEHEYLIVELDTHTDVDEVTLDLLRGWVPIRMADGQVAGFGRWAASYARYREAYNKRWGIEIFKAVARVGVFSAAILIFVLVAIAAPEGAISSASFLAFLAAFSEFSVGIIGLMATIASFARIGPLTRLLAPLLAIEPEVGSRREDPGQLLGALEVRRLGFRYSDDYPWVLRDVSFRAEPGAFVAIVGTSGSGKSTLLRLLLGFEQPRGGGVVLYDDRDLASLDLGAVRSQFGVVLQSSLLLPGTIRENISLSSGSLSDPIAWELLEQVSMAESVRAMPQGLETIIDEGSTLISGGQRQRILLARALAGKPAFLFLDEATSALDNITQQTVTRNIAALGVTRIVIAHRLSTIKMADVIVVLDEGLVVEQGTYDELMDRHGLFASLVERQEL